MNCRQSDRLYSLIHALRDCSFCTVPADIPTILSQMNARRALLPDNTPSTTSIRRLLHSPPPVDAARQMRRTLSDAEEFLSEEYNGFKELLLFQIIRRWNKDDTLTNDDLDSADDQRTRRGLFHLTYRMDPALVAADEQGDVPFVSEDDYQFRISARWQLILDLLSALPCINADDAKGMTDVLRRTCTLGEIPLRTIHERDRESIRFPVLSRLIRHFQTAHKAAGLPLNESPTIPCMDITLGRYDTDSSGALRLVPGQTITAYPVSTQFKDDVYYLSVVLPEQDGFLTRQLRADHILDCAERPDLPRCTPAQLENAAAPDQNAAACGHYEVKDCPETALVEIIDAFGKSGISNCSRETRGDQPFWTFTISIPTRQERRLRMLHDNVRKM